MDPGNSFKHPAVARLSGGAALGTGAPVSGGLGFAPAFAPGRPPRDPRGVTAKKKPRKRRGRVTDFSVVSWDKYFDERTRVVGPDGSSDEFTVYSKGTAGPVVFLLHGGGHSALSWAVFTEALCHTCHCRVMAMDFRGHGTTTCADEEDLSIDTLCADVRHVVRAMLGDEPSPIVLVGHSMGGAVAAHVTGGPGIPGLAGLVVMDVVEGSAMDALSGMVRFLRSRPAQFEDEEAAIRWAVNTGQLRNGESAKVSMPPQLKRVQEGSDAAVQAQRRSLSNTLVEEGEMPEESPVDKESGRSTYIWRVDLERSEQHWRGWFSGLSKAFLSCPAPKLLMLAGVDRLDKELTIGQMQGKFQLVVLAGTGHCVHEDAPDDAAAAISGFMQRQRLVTTHET